MRSAPRKVHNPLMIAVNLTEYGYMLEQARLLAKLTFKTMTVFTSKVNGMNSILGLEMVLWLMCLKSATRP